ncbi:MAG TPA: hypothetical protein VNF47_14440, partial [Streptosporangiaceae bacterium]|nr:hypothetical protein [Streptosporangiaceae bacterium]
DPDFAVRAGRVLDLYQRIWDGCELGEDEYVISSDEKPGIQVLSRVHAWLPPGPRRAGRHEFEYRRNGTIACLAAYDVHRACLTGRVEPSTGIAPFTALTDQVMSAEPYASARRVFWVVDNGASHRNWAAAGVPACRTRLSSGSTACSATRSLSDSNPAPRNCGSSARPSATCSSQWPARSPPRQAPVPGGSR